MRSRSLLIPLLLCAGLAAPAAAAVNQGDFMAKNTGEIVALCSAAQSDPLYQAAVHFCEGYLVGAYQYYAIERAAGNKRPLFCLPDPAPSRDEGVRMFVSWARANPEYMSESGVDSLFRFLATTWPCAR